MNDKIINVVIADDNRFFCDALKDSLQFHKEINILKTLTSLNQVIAYTKTNFFDVLILDINFNGESSLDYIEEIKQDKDFKIIILTTLNTNIFKNKTLKNKHINAFVGKDSELIKFKEIIISTYYSKMENKITLKNKVNIDDLSFTKRKIEVLQSLYKFSNMKEEELSKKLNISVSCLKTHKRELFEITNTKNTPELIKFGIQNRIIVS